MSNKTRLDVLLTERGLAESRQKAQGVIMAGHVFVAGQRVDKPAERRPYRGPRPRSALCEPGRIKAGKGHEDLSHHPDR